MTRRQAIFGAVALGALPQVLAARSHFARNRVSMVTDEIGKTQADALAVLAKYKVQLAELRRVPGSPKEFASLSDVEIKRAAAELAVAKIRVAMLHATNLKPEAVAAATVFGAARIHIETADPAAISANLPSIEAAKMQLVIPFSVDAGALLEKFPSKAFGIDWDPVAAPDAYAAIPKGRMLNLRVKIAAEAGWRRRLEALDRDGYAGGVSLETTLEQSDDSMHDILRMVDDL